MFLAEPRRPVGATATGTLDAGIGSIAGALLCAGADAATAVIRTGGSGGTVIAMLTAPAGQTAEWCPGFCCVHFNNLHVTMTGTAPQLVAYI